MGFGIVLQRVGKHAQRVAVVETVKLYVKVKEGIFGVGVILAFKRGQGVLKVAQHTAHIIIAHLAGNVIVENIGFQLHVAVYQPHLLAGVGIEDSHFCSAVVVQLIGVDKQGVALLHPDIAKRVKRIAHIIEMGAVAVHEHVVFAKHNRPHKELILLLGSHAGLLLVAPHIRMFEKHLSLLIAAGTGYHRLDVLPAVIHRARGGCPCGERKNGKHPDSDKPRGITPKKAQHPDKMKHHARQSAAASDDFSLIQPLWVNSQLRQFSSMRT